MAIRIVSIVKISPQRKTSLNKDIVDILELHYRDEILYILNKNGIINVRKFKGEIILGPGEKYLSSSMVSYYGPAKQFNVTVTSDVRQAIDIDIGDNILWIIDKDRNIIIRHAVLLNKCSIDILNKNISALAIDITTLFQIRTHLPKAVRDILEVDEGNIIMLSLDESDNIIVSQKIVKNLLQEAKILRHGEFTISKKVMNILNIIPGDKILWIFDEDGNIIMRNAILSDNCI